MHFRNIWVREIPSRFANTTHGGPAACEKDVTALRQKTAASLFAKIDANNPVNALRGVLEVLSYDKSPKYWDKYTALRDAYLADLAKQNADGIKARKGDIITLRNDANVLIRNQVFPETCSFRAALQGYIDKYQLEKK